jgi:hypothetical protein
MLPGNRRHQDQAGEAAADLLDADQRAIARNSVDKRLGAVDRGENITPGRMT